MIMVNSDLKGLSNMSCKCLASNKANMSNFHPLEVVGRGSETQLEVGEKLNSITWHFKG